MSLKKDEVAISNIIGAIVFTALLVSTMVLYRVEHIPRVEEDREANGMRNLVADMTRMKADIDHQAENRTNIPISHSLTVGRQGGTGFLKPVATPGSVGFSMYAGSGAFQLASSDVLVQIKDKEPLYGISEEWAALTDGDSVDNLTSVRHLRLRVTDPEGESNGDSVTLTVRDADAAYAGKLVVRYEDVTSDYALVAEVFSANSAATPINVQSETYKSSYQPNYWFMDALEDQLLFDQVLAGAKTPFKLELTTSGMNAEYALSSLQMIDGVETQSGNAGTIVTNFVRQSSAGALFVDAPNQYFPQQKYTMEYGAIILDQPDGQIMQQGPQMTVKATASRVSLTLVVPSLTGVNTTMSGAPQWVAQSIPRGNGITLEARMAEFNMTLKTDYPDVWMAYWNETLGSAGLSSIAGHFTVSKTVDAAVLRMQGVDSSPAVRDVAIQLQQAQVEMRLRPAA